MFIYSRAKKFAGAERVQVVTEVLMFYFDPYLLKYYLDLGINENLS